jgi:glutathione S-transferase
MRLYYDRSSSHSRRAIVTAFHLGAPVELVRVDLGHAEHRQPAYLRLNPNGKVPTLEDAGFVLWESHAIQQYLADITPGQTVYPVAPRERADVNRWLFWSAQHFTPGVGVLNWEHRRKAMLGAGAPDPREIERGERMVLDGARLLDAHLTSRRWLAQDRLTIADLAVAAPLMQTVPARLPVQPFVHLQRWFAEIEQLDAWQRAVALDTADDRAPTPAHP